MIISHKYKFIFIKTSKTAGTSIEIALSGICGKDDIITNIGPQDERLRNDFAGMRPQNYYIHSSEYTLTDYIKCYFGNKKKFRAHSGAAYIKKNIAPEIWNSYFKFCFERNPWDRVVSLYYFQKTLSRNRKNSFSSISDFISTDKLRGLKNRGYCKYTLSGDIVVNRVCLYENLEAELEYVCNYILGISMPFTLPNAKGQYRPDSQHYREILNRKDRDRIALVFKDEIKRFGYTF